MLILRSTSKFKKDYKRMKKQGKDLTFLESVIDDLLNEKVLDEKYQDHPLVGNYIGFRECHVQPDWLLIYAIDSEQLILTTIRTGSHNDLFRLPPGADLNDCHYCRRRIGHEEKKLSLNPDNCRMFDVGPRRFYDISRFIA